MALLQPGGGSNREGGFAPARCAPKAQEFQRKGSGNGTFEVDARVPLVTLAPSSIATKLIEKSTALRSAYHHGKDHWN
jgi:hypothetical protein